MNGIKFKRVFRGNLIAICNEKDICIGTTWFVIAEEDENGIFFQHTNDGEKFYYTDAKCYQKRKATEEEKQNLLGKIII